MADIIVADQFWLPPAHVKAVGPERRLYFYWDLRIRMNAAADGAVRQSALFSNAIEMSGCDYAFCAPVLASEHHS